VDLSGPVPTNEQLEKQCSLILQNQERVNELKLKQPVPRRPKMPPP